MRCPVAAAHPLVLVLVTHALLSTVPLVAQAVDCRNGVVAVDGSCVCNNEYECQGTSCSQATVFGRRLSLFTGACPDCFCSFSPRKTCPPGAFLDNDGDCMCPPHLKCEDMAGMCRTALSPPDALAPPQHPIPDLHYFSRECASCQCVPKEASMMQNTSACSDNEWYDTAIRACVPLTNCSPGTRVFLHPTAVRDRLCMACAEGTFTSGRNQLHCTRHTACDPKTHVIGKEATPTADRTCLCAPGFRHASAHGDDSSSSASSSSSFAGGGANGAVGEGTKPTPSGHGQGEYAAGMPMCEPCPEGTFSESPGSAECRPQPVCAPGYEVAGRSPSTNEHHIVQCPKGFCKSLHHCSALCMSVRQCAPGREYALSEPTISSDRVCAPVTSCNASQFVAQPSTPTTDAICAPLTTCGSGKYEHPGSFPWQDRHCLVTSTCVQGETFQAWPPTPTSDRVCMDIRTCAIEVAPPTLTSDAVCRDEATNCTTQEYFATGTGACRPLTTCSINRDEFEAVAPTTTTDRACAAVSTCAEHQFEAFPPTPTADRVCQNATTACGPASFMVASHTPYRDAVCRDVTVCSAHQFEALAPTPSSDRLCLDLQPCLEGEEFELQPPTATTDRHCVPVRTCRDNEFMAQGPTTTTNTICTHIKNCTQGQYEAAPPTPTSDRICRSYSYCSTHAYVVAEGTPTSDRVCVLLQHCPASSYQLAPATSTSSVQCSPYSSCAAQQYAARSATSTSDVECSNVTQCAFPQQYQAVAPTPSSDAVCEAVSVCGPMFFEVLPPTPSSDRYCTSLTPCHWETQYMSVLPTPTSDCVCANTSECVPPAYEVLPHTRTSDRVCSTTPVGSLFTVAVAFDIGGFATDALRVSMEEALVSYLRRQPVMAIGYVGVRWRKMPALAALVDMEDHRAGTRLLDLSAITVRDTRAGVVYSGRPQALVAPTATITTTTTRSGEDGSQRGNAGTSAYTSTTAIALFSLVGALAVIVTAAVAAVLRMRRKTPRLAPGLGATLGGGYSDKRFGGGSGGGGGGGGGDGSDGDEHMARTVSTSSPRGASARAGKSRFFLSARAWRQAWKRGRKGREGLRCVRSADSSSSIATLVSNGSDDAEPEHTPSSLPPAAEEEESYFQLTPVRMARRAPSSAGPAGERTASSPSSSAGPSNVPTRAASACGSVGASIIIGSSGDAFPMGWKEKQDRQEQEYQENAWCDKARVPGGGLAREQEADWVMPGATALDRPEPSAGEDWRVDPASLEERRGLSGHRLLHVIAEEDEELEAEAGETDELKPGKQDEEEHGTDKGRYDQKQLERGWHARERGSWDLGRLWDTGERGTTEERHDAYMYTGVVPQGMDALVPAGCESRHDYGASLWGMGLVAPGDGLGGVESAASRGDGVVGDPALEGVEEGHGPRQGTVATAHVEETRFWASPMSLLAAAGDDGERGAGRWRSHGDSGERLTVDLTVADDGALPALDELQA